MAGELARYLALIAETADRAAQAGTRVVLAQASMAAATALCVKQPIPLTSPLVGLRAAVAAALS